jgi:hypothetical protein
MGNFVPWRDSAWAVLTERVRVLADRCDAVQAQLGSAGTVPGVAATVRRIASQLAGHVPPELLAGDTSSER